MPSVRIQDNRRNRREIRDCSGEMQQVRIQRTVEFETVPDAEAVIQEHTMAEKR